MLQLMSKPTVCIQIRALRHYILIFRPILQKLGVCTYVSLEVRGWEMRL